MRVSRMLCCAAAMALFLAPSARADEWNKKTFLTFSGPVQVPGATLPAGTYTFELANPDTTRHVIRVSSQDGSKNYAMFITIPAERLEPPDQNVVMFAERPAGAPQAVQVWFYPGDRIGEEFVYPRSQAIQIAKAAHKSVLATTSDKLADTSAAKGATVGRVNESGQMTENSSASAYNAPTTTAPATTAPSTTAAPSNTVTGSRRPSANSTMAQANTTEQPAGTSGQANARSQQRKRLPQTASDLTALELLSVLAIGGGLALHRARRRSIAG
jgi:hypothetical protein